MALPKQLKRFLNHQGQSYEYTLQADTKQSARIQLKVLSAKAKGSPLHSQIQAIDLFPTDVAACVELALNQGWQPELAGQAFKLSPDQLSLKAVQTAPAEANFQLVPVIENLSGELLFSSQLTDADWLSLLADQFAEWLADPQSTEILIQSFVELSPGLSGGFSLLSDKQIFVQPDCCCGLWSVADWEAVLDQDAGEIWTGHGKTVPVSFERGLKTICLKVNRSESVWLSFDDYHLMLAQAHHQLHLLCQRLEPILNQLFQTKIGHQLAQILVFKQLESASALDS